MPLAGGDILNGSGDPTIEAVVDLQALGLTEISLAPNLGALSVQAMVKRAQLAELKAPATAGSHALKASPLGIIAAGAQRWGGNVQRNRATLGGALATAASNDPLVVALLVSDGAPHPALLKHRLSDRAAGRVHPDRAAFLAAPALITDVVVPLPPGRLTGYALADVARTPADAPIVVAGAMICVAYGRCTHVRLALGGVRPVPYAARGGSAAGGSTANARGHCGSGRARLSRCTDRRFPRQRRVS